MTRVSNEMVLGFCLLGLKRGNPYVLYLLPLKIKQSQKLSPIKRKVGNLVPWYPKSDRKFENFSFGI